MNLYVSNLAYSVTDEDLQNEFAAYGTVAHARVVKDRETNRSRGFGFVDMPDDAEAVQAMTGLNGANVAGRAIKVVEARPKEERPPRPAGSPPPRRDGPSERRSGPPAPKQEPWNDFDDRPKPAKGGKGGGKWDRDKDRGFSRGGKRSFDYFEED